MLIQRITKHPLPFDPDAGADAVEALAPPAEARDLVRGVAGCSPYLAKLIAAERAWLEEAWHEEPESSMEAILTEIAALEGEPGPALRRAKHRAALLIALCETGGVWPVMEATAWLTRFADAALAKCLTFGLTKFGRPPVEGDGGLVAMAMGKMGAHELNYSSDIDLVLLFDEHRYDPGDYAAARAVLLKAARRAMAQMSDITADGYVFRTDLRLRPDPGSTPIVLSMEQAERYYEAMGRTWERAAWIKARPAAGDIAAGERFLDRISPFVWRRHLDFAVVEEALDMRRRIRDHKGLHNAWNVPGHDLKLGQGGIREIEFLTQTQQIIAGGRNPSLRVRGTLDGLDRLVDGGQLGPTDRDVLADEYCYLRSLEHRVQMVQDAQTHRLPKDREGLERIACFMGQGDVDAFVADTRARLERVEAIADPSFRPLSERGDAQPPTAQIEGADALMDRWTTYPALRSDRARAIFARLRPQLLAALSRALRPAEALTAFDGFLAGLPAGVQIFSLFEANPKLVALLADICATAPDLARYLSANAGVLDAVIAGDFLAMLPETFTVPDMPDGFEDRLNHLRRWHREAHFRIGVHLLRGFATPAFAGKAYAALAEATLSAAWDAAEAETARRYGRVPGLRVAGMGMGSLGSGRLTARSDLDLVVLHDGAEPGAVSDGRRGLAAAQWAAKFTQVLITALSAPTAEGQLYEVDMRLRPSGRQGPVATALSAFRSYQAQEAWVWEHMALTRARPIVGDDTIRQEAEGIRRDVLSGTRFDTDAVLAALRDMRARLSAAGRVGGGLSVKSGPGRMQDIELAAQAHALIVGTPTRLVADQLNIAGWLTEEERGVLAQAHDLMARVQQVVRLLTPEDPPSALGTGAAALLARTLKKDDAAGVMAACDGAAAAAAKAIDQALDRGGLAD